MLRWRSHHSVGPSLYVPSDPADGPLPPIFHFPTQVVTFLDHSLQDSRSTTPLAFRQFLANTFFPASLSPSDLHHGSQLYQWTSTRCSVRPARASAPQDTFCVHLDQPFDVFWCAVVCAAQLGHLRRLHNQSKLVVDLRSTSHGNSPSIQRTSILGTQPGRTNRCQPHANGTGTTATTRQTVTATTSARSPRCLGATPKPPTGPQGNLPRPRAGPLDTENGQYTLLHTWDTSPVPVYHLSPRQLASSRVPSMRPSSTDRHPTTHHRSGPRGHSHPPPSGDSVITVKWVNPGVSDSALLADLRGLGLPTPHDTQVYAGWHNIRVLTFTREDDVQRLLRSKRHVLRSVPRLSINSGKLSSPHMRPNERKAIVSALRASTSSARHRRNLWRGGRGQSAVPSPPPQQPAHLPPSGRPSIPTKPTSTTSTTTPPISCDNP